jgi:hypothetical protein
VKHFEHSTLHLPTLSSWCEIEGSRSNADERPSFWDDNDANVVMIGKQLPVF